MSSRLDVPLGMPEAEVVVSDASVSTPPAITEGLGDVADSIARCIARDRLSLEERIRVEAGGVLLNGDQRRGSR